MSEPSTTRRGFLGHVAGAYMAAGALPVMVAHADPLADLLAAYETENRMLNEYPGGIPEDLPTPAFSALDDGAVPGAQTKGAALQALRVAMDENDQMGGFAMVSNLIAASLAYFEANA